MPYEHEKSGVTILLDVIRNIFILVATGFVVFLLWKWHWLVAVLAAIPVYIVTMNLVGFLTLPLYMLTPENKLKAKAFKAFQNGNCEQGKALTDEFTEKFNVNIPEESTTATESVEFPLNTSLDQIEYKLEKIQQKALSSSSEKEKQSLLKELNDLRQELDLRYHKRETELEVIRLDLEQDLLERKICSGKGEFFPTFKNWFSLSSNKALDKDEAMISYSEKLESAYAEKIASSKLFGSSE